MVALVGVLLERGDKDQDTQIPNERRVAMGRASGPAIDLRPAGEKGAGVLAHVISALRVRGQSLCGVASKVRNRETVWAGERGEQFASDVKAHRLASAGRVEKVFGEKAGPGVKRTAGHGHSDVSVVLSSIPSGRKGVRSQAMSDRGKRCGLVDLSVTRRTARGDLGTVEQSFHACEKLSRCYSCDDLADAFSACPFASASFRNSVWISGCRWDRYRATRVFSVSRLR